MDKLTEIERVSAHLSELYDVSYELWVAREDYELRNNLERLEEVRRSMSELSEQIRALENYLSELNKPNSRLKNLMRNKCTQY